MSEEIKENKAGELEQGEFKVKKKPRKLASKKDTTVKLDLTKKEEPKKEVEVEAVKEEKPVVEAVDEKKVEKPKEETKEEIVNPLSESTVEEVEKPKVEEVKNEEPATSKPTVELPENVEKLVNFMKETGGNLEDYVRLSADYSAVDEETLLREYYKSSKPHLDNEEINFIMEDNFSYDKDVDEERDIKKKKLAYKEEIAKARNFLEQTKSKYYEEIKLRPTVTNEQKRAMEFFNRYNEEDKLAEQNRKLFLDKSNDLLNNEEFKGFKFNVGDKTFNYGVNKNEQFYENQNDINKIFEKFLDQEGRINDYNSYHKAIFAAHNVDSIAKHFYDQGKADAVKDVMAKSKNINNEAAPSPTGDIFINGLKVKAVSGVDTSKLKVKYKK